MTVYGDTRTVETANFVSLMVWRFDLKRWELVSRTVKELYFMDIQYRFKVPESVISQLERLINWPV